MTLVLDRLAGRRGGRLLFAGIDAAVAPGGVLALRGPNGVGKSTLLRVLAGLIPVADGDARIGDVSLGKNRGAFQERVLYAGHLDAVKPALPVAENLALWAALEGTGEARVAAALERFGLARMADRPAAECSAGQKRRLGLARLMVIDRPLWLLDEPTVSLDTASVALVAEIVREHLSAGGMALIATHADLGLGHVETLEMRPREDGPAPEDGREPPGETAGADDPFLAGRW